MRQSLHVLSEAEIGAWGKANWSSPYKRTAFNLARDNYIPLINSGRYRVLIYSGDADACMYVACHDITFSAVWLTFHCVPALTLELRSGQVR